MEVRFYVSSLDVASISDVRVFQVVATSVVHSKPLADPCAKAPTCSPSDVSSAWVNNGTFATDVQCSELLISCSGYFV